MTESIHTCSDCTDPPAPDRRTFLAAAGGALLTAAPVWSSVEPKKSAESYSQELYQSLNADQQKAACMPWSHPKRMQISANWKITKLQIEHLDQKQQEICDRILRGLSSPEGYEKFKTQMADDSGGLGDHAIAFFGKPGDKQFEFVLTGRHATMRSDGNFSDGVAFAGPIVYGHQGASEPEKKDHPTNVFWHQAKRANEVFKALDGKQREKALVTRAPKEDQIKFRKAGYPGLAVGEMPADQQKLVAQVMRDLLAPYRAEDADEAMKVIAANGGLEKLHLSFYKQDSGGRSVDLGDDGVWDVWRLEGPGLVWHFRGAPHVHVWVNIAKAT